MTTTSNLYTANLNRNGQFVILTESDVTGLSDHDRSVLYSNVREADTDSLLRSASTFSLAEFIVSVETAGMAEGEAYDYRMQREQELTMGTTRADLRSEFLAAVAKS